MRLFLTLAFASSVLSLVPDLKLHWREGWYRASVGHNGFNGAIWWNANTNTIEMNFNKKPDFNEFNWYTHGVAYADQWHVETGVARFDISKLGVKAKTISTDQLVNMVENETNDGTYTMTAELAHDILLFHTITLSKDGSDSFCGGTFVYGKVDNYVWNHDEYQSIVYAYPKALSINFLKFADPVGDYMAIIYAATDCVGDSETTTGSLTSVNEWFRVASSSDIMSMKFSTSGKCHNLNMGKKSTNYVQLNAPGIRMRFEQNTVFEPTYYWLDYNMKKSKSDEALGGYHVHKWPLPDSEMNSPNWGDANCGDTGGHWNPYGIVKPANGFESGREQEYYEVGDLASKFGSLSMKKKYKGYWCDFNLPLFGVNSIEQRSIVFHAAAGGARKLCYNLRNSDMGERNNMHFVNSWTHESTGLLMKASLYQPRWNSPTAFHIYTEATAEFPVSSMSIDAYLNEGMCSGVAASGLPGALNTVNFKPADSGMPMAKGASSSMSSSRLTNMPWTFTSDAKMSMVFKRLSGAWMIKDTMYSVVIVDDAGNKMECFDVYKPLRPLQVSGMGQLSLFDNETCMNVRKPIQRIDFKYGIIKDKPCKSNVNNQVFYNDAWAIRTDKDADVCLTAIKRRVGLDKCKKDSMQMWALNDKNKPALAAKPNKCITRKGKKMVLTRC